MKNSLCKVLNIDLYRKEVISFVGGGGKTTAMFALADELKTLGKRVLITTTTNIFIPKEGSFDQLFLKDVDLEKIEPGSLTIFGEEVRDKKIKGPDLEVLDILIKKDLFDYYLIEADGAKHKPIKAPASHEPVISALTTKTIGLIGLDALHKSIVEISHRSEILSELLNKKSSEKVEVVDIIKLVLHTDGLFKDYKGEAILLLNKTVNAALIEEGLLIKRILNKSNFKNVIIADVMTRSFY